MPETRPPIDLAHRTLSQLAAEMGGRKLPPVRQWNPPHCGTSGMRIDREGRWWHDGRRINRPELVRLFASVLRREEDGTHVLVTPVEKLDIEVELAALRVIGMKQEGERDEARIAFQLNRGDIIFLGFGNPLHMKSGVPLLAAGEGIEASFERPVYYELAELALDHDPPGVWSGGSFFSMESDR